MFPMTNKKPNNDSKIVTAISHIWALVISALFGIYLTDVGIECIIDKKIPEHMGPTLDFYMAPFKIFGSPADIYMSGGFLIIVGSFFLLFVPIVYLISRFRKKP